jgi:hypothetical protein
VLNNLGIRSGAERFTIEAMMLSRWSTLVLGLVALVAAGCEGVAAPSADTPAEGSQPRASAVPPAQGGDLGSLPSGPAILVAEGYQAPRDKVDSTGAYIPANGKPTLVWVDAIW